MKDVKTRLQEGQIHKDTYLYHRLWHNAHMR